MNRLYELSAKHDAFKYRASLVKPEPYFRWYELLKGVYDNFSFPIKFQQQKGQMIADIIATGFPSMYLISAKVYQVFVENSISGWNTYPVEILGFDGKEIMGYHGFSITGRSGAKDFTNSPILEKQYAPNGPISKHYVGYEIKGVDENTPDIFLPLENATIIVNEKVFKLLKPLKLTNIGFTHTGKKEIWDYIADGYRTKLDKLN